MNESPQFTEDSEEQEPDNRAIKKALSLSAVALTAIVLAGVAIALFVQRSPKQKPTTPKDITLPIGRQMSSVKPPDLKFSDITAQSGIDFVHTNLATGKKLLPETMGGGCAFFDYDGDGDQDLLFTDSNRWPWDPEDKARPSLRLYINDGTGTFSDHTSKANLNVSCYGMGVAISDYDSDGDQDIFVSAVGPDFLLKNEGGKYIDVTAAAGVAGDQDSWGSSCGWCDYDNDGDLDLVVGNYVTWTPEIDLAQDFRLTGIGRAYGPPFSFSGSFPYLFQNQGNGTFKDVANAAGLHITNEATSVPLAKTLGVCPVDLNGDGWIDIVLANDTVQNLVFMNNRDGTFREQGAQLGVAFNVDGKARGAMGVDAARFRNDHTLGVVIANFANEMTALYVSTDGGEVFSDDAVSTGIGPQSRSDLTFGLFFLDADLDGRLDLFTANGHIEGEIQRVQNGQHYRQQPRLYWNAGAKSASEFIHLADIPGFDKSLVGRGASCADIDSDGDLDLLITQVAGPPTLLRNEQALRNHYLRVKLVGKQGNRDAIGAEVTVRSARQTLNRCVMPTRGYLSQVELPLTFGLGAVDHVERLSVRWPDGSEQIVDEVKIDGETIVRQTTSK